MDYSRQQGKVGALGGEDNQTRGGELEWITSTVPSEWLTDSWTSGPTLSCYSGGKDPG